MIPTEGLRHAPTVAILNYLVWFFESAVDEEQDPHCHYAPGSSFFIWGSIALREHIIIMGGATWEQTTKHYRAFSTINNHHTTHSRTGTKKPPLDYDGAADMHWKPWC
jgi:hypothetical protein